MKHYSLYFLTLMFCISGLLHAQAKKNLSNGSSSAAHSTSNASTSTSSKKLEENGFKEDKALRSRMTLCENLVNEAVAFFESTTLAQACRSFEKDERWNYADIGIDVFDAQGYCYLFGTEFATLWVNFKDVEKSAEIRGTTETSTGFIEEMVKKADQGGGWVSFDWNYTTNYSYVRSVIKDGVKFLLFSGFFPESQRFQTMQMVKSAIRYGTEHGADAVFRQINNPSGNYVKGPIYLWSYDIEGNYFADGHNLALIGQNVLDWQDAEGNYTDRTIIEMVKKHGSGWVEGENYGDVQYSYAEAFFDKSTGKQYIIGGSYYPFVSNDTVIAFVKRAVEYLKAQGKTVALRDFSSYTGGFLKGPLRIMVFDLDGQVLADGENPIFIGQNVMNMKGPDGTYHFRSLIELAKKQGHGWIAYTERRDFKSVYFEYVETPDGKFVIASGYWPSSKEFSVKTLVDKAATYLENTYNPEAFYMLCGNSPDFLRGNLFIEVYSDDGICIVYGLDLERAWNDETKILDDKGHPLINRVIDVAQRGGGWTEYPMNKANRRVYAKMITKPIKAIPGEKIDIREKITTVKKDGVVRKETSKTAPREQNFIVAVGYYPL